MLVMYQNVEQCDSNKSNANEHVQMRETNNGEKSNQCNVCDFSSSWNSKLRRHLKTHSREKSNKCNQCDYTSSGAYNLKTHSKTHNGEIKQMQPMWLCLFPGKQFDKKSQTNVSNVTMHMKMQLIRGHIWKHTVQKSYTNLTNVTLRPLGQTLWQNIRKYIFKLDQDIVWNIARSRAGLLGLKIELTWQKDNARFSAQDLNLFLIGIS